MTKNKIQFDIIEFMDNVRMIALTLALVYGLVASAFFITDDALKERQKKMDGCCAQCKDLSNKKGE